MGYAPFVAHQLAGKIDVRHIGQQNASIENCTGTSPGSACAMANGGDSCRGYECIGGAHDRNCEGGSCWTGSQAGFRWDVVTFNFGLHDIELSPNASRSPGPSDYEVPIASYKILLHNITAALLEVTDRLIWVDTTPMPVPTNASTGDGINRRNADVIAYNKAARAVIGSFDKNISIVPLYDFIIDHCGQNYQTCDWQPKPPHFQGHYDKLAANISSAIEQALGAE
jgi:hypothetical protein